MDPDVVIVMILGGLGMAGRLRKKISPAGGAARNAARTVVAPIQSGARYVMPVAGGAVATVAGVVGTVVGESVGEVLDGVAAAGDWVRARQAPQV
ncbi:MAG: hypothetical protein NVS3B12_04530 [Acidimicrobiales bacterium]